MNFKPLQNEFKSSNIKLSSQLGLYDINDWLWVCNWRHSGLRGR